MTILGKVLVFANLVFAFITGAFIVMVSAKQTNWRNNSKEWQDRYSVLQKVAETAVADKQRTVIERDQEIKKLQGDVAAEHQAAEALKVQLDNAQKELAGAQTRIAASSAAETAATEESRRLIAENQGLRTQVTDKDKRIVEIENQSQKYKDEMVAAQINYRVSQERNERLLAELRDVQKQVEMAKAKAAGTGIIPAGAKAAPEDLEAVVTESEPKNGLATISLGTDSGIAKGNVLYVYRLEPKPEYVGQIEIVDARAHQAVGRAVQPLRAGPIKKGDHVSSTILGRR